MIPFNQYLIGDAIEVLREIPAGSVQCCITSPPYWGLRTYGDDGQYGLEPTPEEHVSKMVEVFREVRRVLRDDGTLWLNYGDSYVSAKGRYSTVEQTISGGKNRGEPINQRCDQKGHPTLKDKDLCMIPHRVAMALQADGWWVRQDIVWSKPNPMPESCTDRPTRSHEYIFLMSKRANYFYDADAVREPSLTDPDSAASMTFGSVNGKLNTVEKAHAVDVGHKWEYESTRNLRSVWAIPTYPFPGAHFATFPPKLVERCILTGTAAKACEVCGEAWERVVEVGGGIIGKSWHDHDADLERGNLPNAFGIKNMKDGTYQRKYLGFRPTCSCEQKGEGRCVVLDCFMGSGTVAMVAESLGRDWIGIDIQPTYKDLALKRIGQMGLGI